MEYVQGQQQTLWKKVQSVLKANNKETRLSLLKMGYHLQSQQRTLFTPSTSGIIVNAEESNTGWDGLYF